MGDELSITQSVEGENATVVLVGNLSTISSPYLAEEFEKLDGVKNIDLDITGIDYISQDGFDLLATKRDDLAAKGGKLVIMHPNDMLEDMIEDLGLREQFEIVD